MIRRYALIIAGAVLLSLIHIYLAGKVIWSDLGAVLMRLDNGRELIVQRHIVDRWEMLAG